MAKYADITSITAPSSAAPGAKVDVVAKVKNIDSVNHVLRCIDTYIVDSELSTFSDEVVIINAGQTYSFTGSFIMPNIAAVIKAFTYYTVGPDWFFDDSMEKSIALAALPSPEFSGFIISDYSKK